MNYINCEFSNKKLLYCLYKDIINLSDKDKYVQLQNITNIISLYLKNNENADDALMYFLINIKESPKFYTPSLMLILNKFHIH
jgi:hypothetical protein